jgi:hypothetical protein
VVQVAVVEAAVVVLALLPVLGILQLHLQLREVMVALARLLRLSMVLAAVAVLLQ